MPVSLYPTDINWDNINLVLDSINCPNVSSSYLVLFEEIITNTGELRPLTLMYLLDLIQIY